MLDQYDNWYGDVYLKSISSISTYNFRDGLMRMKAIRYLVSTVKSTLNLIKKIVYTPIKNFISLIVYIWTSPYKTCRILRKIPDSH